MFNPNCKRSQVQWLKESRLTTPNWTLWTHRNKTICLAWKSNSSCTGDSFMSLSIITFTVLQIQQGQSGYYLTPDVVVLVPCNVCSFWDMRVVKVVLWHTCIQYSIFLKRWARSNLPWQRNFFPWFKVIPGEAGFRTDCFKIWVYNTKDIILLTSIIVSCPSGICLLSI